MKLDYAFLASAAEVAEGKLYVVGGNIEIVWTQGVPLVLPLISVAVRLLAEPGELDRPHPFEVVLMDGDGQKTQLMRHTLTIARNPLNETWREQPHMLTLSFANTRFERFGEYSFEILIGGIHMKGLPFRVMQRQAAGAQ